MIHILKIVGFITCGFIVGHELHLYFSNVEEEKNKKYQAKVYLKGCLQEANRRFDAHFRCPDSLEDRIYKDPFGSLSDRFRANMHTGNFTICTLYYNALYDHDSPLAFLVVQSYVNGFLKDVNCYQKGVAGEFEARRTYSRQSFIDLLLCHDFVFDREKYLKPVYADEDEKQSYEFFLATPCGPDYIAESCMSTEFLAPLRRNGDL